jgi:hypothetical protein
MLASFSAIWISNIYDIGIYTKVIIALIYLGITGYYIYMNYKDSAEFKKVLEIIKKFRNKGVTKEDETISSEP